VSPWPHHRFVLEAEVRGGQDMAEESQDIFLFLDWWSKCLLLKNILLCGIS
jgi:hypothetical protein